MKKLHLLFLSIVLSLNVLIYIYTVYEPVTPVLQRNTTQMHHNVLLTRTLTLFDRITSCIAHTNATLHATYRTSMKRTFDAKTRDTPNITLHVILMFVYLSSCVIIYMTYVMLCIEQLRTKVKTFSTSHIIVTCVSFVYFMCNAFHLYVLCV